MNINKKQKLQTPGSRRRLVTALGITGWLFKGVLSVFTAAFLIMAAAGLILYAAVKPELDKCREIAYDKLAQMDRSDFSMLSDTVIYDKDGKQIGEKRYSVETQDAVGILDNNPFMGGI